MADRPEDAVALTDDELEEMALEPSSHHLEPANRDDLPSEEPPAERPSRAKRRPQARPEAQKEDEAEVAERSSGKGEGEEEEGEAGRPPARAEEALDDEGLPPEEPAAIPEAPAAVVGKPFKFKAAGADHLFPGVEELPDGSAKMTKEAANQFRVAMASTIETRNQAVKERREAQRTIQRLTTERTAKDVNADYITGLFDKVTDTTKMTDEEAWDWLQKLRADAPQLKLQIREQILDLRAKELEAQQRGPELLPEEQEEQFTKTVQTEVHSTFMRLLKSPEARYLPDDDRKRLYEKWIRKGHTLVSIQGKDAIFDDQEIVDDFLYLVNLRKDSAKALKTGQRNAELNADQEPKGAPPPVVRGGRRPASNGKEEQKKYGRGQKRAFAKDFMAGSLDSKDEG